jgi:hypothetical protein
MKTLERLDRSSQFQQPFEPLTEWVKRVKKISLDVAIEIVENSNIGGDELIMELGRKQSYNLKALLEWMGY